MAKYVKHICDCLLPDKDQKENILKENPVAKNNDQIKILDHFFAKIVEGRQETCKGRLVKFLKQCIQKSEMLCVQCPD